MKYKYEFEIDKSIGFEKGDCMKCPLSYTDYGYEDYGVNCVLCARYDECPLEGVSENNEC
jgi:hypothetical protein